MTDPIALFEEAAKTMDTGGMLRAGRMMAEHLKAIRNMQPVAITAGNLTVTPTDSSVPYSEGVELYLKPPQVMRYG